MRIVFFLLMSLSFSASYGVMRANMPLQQLPGDKGGSSDSANVESSMGKDTLSGAYFGLNAMLVHMNTKIDQNTLGGTGGFVGLTFGAGKKVRKVYLAGELDVNYGGLLATKKSYGKIAGNMDIGGAFRIGYAGESKIMPYLKLGFGWTGYKLKQNGLKEKFNSVYFAPGIGIEMPILTSSMLRLEAAYSMNLANKDPKGHTLQSKPARIIVKAGGYTRF